MKSGQVLILVLLVVVVALAIGLSAASRNIINLRTSTQTEQSQRAFSAAEGGVEKVLSDIPANIGQKTFDVGDLKAKVDVVASSVYERSVSRGDVAQIDLRGANGQVQILWAKSREDADDNKPASIEVTQISGASPFSQQRWYWQGDSSRAFETGSFAAGCTPPAGSDYRKCAQVTIAAAAQILRVRPFWASTSIKVSGIADTIIPTQAYDITSTASTDIGVTRKVQVTRTALPQLPAVFDYVLYSEEEINK